jgi:hypothetical protein
MSTCNESPNDVPTNANSVDVTINSVDAQNDPTDIWLSGEDVVEDVINFTADKRFIRFTFPDGYEDFSIKVFEPEDAPIKQGIMDEYQSDASFGIAQYDALWKGKASKQRDGESPKREFVLKSPNGQTMILRDRDQDGNTEDGTLHNFILKFTYGKQTYLFDPQIRNKEN